MEDVRLARVAKHLGFAPQEAKTVVELLTLRYGNPNVGFAVNDKGGGVTMLEETDGRMLIVQLAIRGEVAVVTVQIARSDICGGGHGEEVGDSGADDGGLEAISVGDDPGSHEAAEAPSADAKTIGIGDTFGYQEIDSVHDVLKIATAPITIVGFRKCGTAAIRTTWVRQEHGITVRGQDDAPIVPNAMKAGLPSLLWTAMDMHNRFVAAAFVVAGRKEKDTVDCGSVFGASPRKVLGGAETPASDLRIRIRQLQRLVSGLDEELFGMFGSLGQIGDLLAIFAESVGTKPAVGSVNAGDLGDRTGNGINF